MRPDIETGHKGRKLCGQPRLNPDQGTDGHKTLHHVASV
jgi:hypothetical protein